MRTVIDLERLEVQDRGKSFQPDSVMDLLFNSVRYRVNVTQFGIVVTRPSNPWEIEFEGEWEGCTIIGIERVRPLIKDLPAEIDTIQQWSNFLGAVGLEITVTPIHSNPDRSRRVVFLAIGPDCIDPVSEDDFRRVMEWYDATPQEITMDSFLETHRKS